MDPHSKKARDIALKNIFQIEKLIEIHKKALSEPPKPVQKPQPPEEFYTIKEVD